MIGTASAKTPLQRHFADPCCGSRSAEGVGEIDTGSESEARGQTWRMDPAASDRYLQGLPEDVAEMLRATNRPGMAALRRYLAESGAIAFLGAGVSAPLLTQPGAVASA
jgi:hypothetical protein